MRISIASCLALGSVVLLTQGAAGQLLDKKVLTLEAARKIVTLTQRAWPEDFAVVDWSGNPVAGGDLPGEIVGQSELACDPI
jgi:hypothetical protein